MQESFLTTTTTCRGRGGKRERKEKKREEERLEEREGGKWKRRGESKECKSDPGGRQMEEEMLAIGEEEFEMKRRKVVTKS